MTGIESKYFYLGDWRVEPAAGRVTRGEESATLRPREMDLLCYLAREPGAVRSTDDIIRDVWSGVHVTNDSLYFSISQLRKVLDDKACDGSIVETIPKRGYRLTARVAPGAVDDAGGDSAPDAGIPSADTASHPGSAATADASAGAGADRGRRWRPAIPIAVLVAFAASGLLWLWANEDVADFDSDSVAAPADSIDVGSIAVMPFIDLTPEADYTYFSDGITEEILNRLTRVPGLRVAARTSSFTFKDSDAGVIEIGRALGVANLLEGSVRKEGNRVRIAVQLIDAGSGFQRWSESYDRQLTSVFEIQNEISRRVTDALEITLAGGQLDGGSQADRPASAAVLDDYLLGLEAYRTQTFESLASAAGHFRTVLSQDPSFNNARVQLAATYLQQLNTGATDDMTLVTEAQSLLETVLAEQPGNASAHRVMGMALKWLGQSDEARRELDIALGLAPSDSQAMTQLAHILGFEGEVRESRRLLSRALRVDPFSNAVLHSYAIAERQFGAIDNAEWALERAVDLHPKNPNPVWLLGTLQARDQGRLAQGLDNFRLAAELDTDDYEIAAYVAATYLTLGMSEAAEPWIERAERDGHGSATTLALHAITEAIRGQSASAAEISLDALRQGSYRIHAHSLITRAFLTLAIADLAGSDDPGSAIAGLESLAPAKKMNPDALAVAEDLDAQLAFSDLSRHWLVGLATAYRAAGLDEKLASAMDGLAVTRIGALGEFRDALRNDDYLLEAEVRALEGDVDGAFDMLGQAVEEQHLYLWQLSYERNPAFADLRGDARWDGLMTRIRERIDEERLLVTTTLGMAVGESVD